MATGTNHYRRTRVELSRVARLHPDKDQKGIQIRTPNVDYRLEIRAALIFAVTIGAAVVALIALLNGGLLAPDSEARLMLSFGLGLAVACALASSLTFLINLRHYLLLISLSMALFAAGALALGWTPVESVAKIVFAAATGLWIALMLTSVGQVLLISLLIIIVDIWSVFLGPTKKMVESGGPWVEYFTISLPVFGADAASRLGVSDIIFFALFLGCTMTLHLRRALTAFTLTLSFVATMVVGVTLDIGVPALPLLSVFFLLTNGDLLYHRFLEEPDQRRRDKAGG